MGLGFWDTIRGHELADCLIRELPKLASEKKQCVSTMSDHKVHEFLTENVNKGFSYVGHFSEGGMTTVILVKTGR